MIAGGPTAADFNALYFGTLVAFQLGGEPWARWRPFLADAVRRAETSADPRTAPLSRPMLLLVREIASRYRALRPAAGAGGG